MSKCGLGSLINTSVGGSVWEAGCLAEVVLQVLAHAEGLYPFLAEHGLHGFVRGEELLVFGILNYNKY